MVFLFHGLLNSCEMQDKIGETLQRELDEYEWSNFCVGNQATQTDRDCMMITKETRGDIFTIVRSIVNTQYLIEMIVYLKIVMNTMTMSFCTCSGYTESHLRSWFYLLIKILFLNQISTRKLDHPLTNFKCFYTVPFLVYSLLF